VDGCGWVREEAGHCVAGLLEAEFFAHDQEHALFREAAEQCGQHLGRQVWAERAVGDAAARQRPDGFAGLLAGLAGVPSPCMQEDRAVQVAAQPLDTVGRVTGELFRGRAKAGSKTRGAEAR
jgi:hypothetical protein